jgi:glutaredoxin
MLPRVSAVLPHGPVQVFLVGATLILAAPCTFAQYKWVDADGHVTYGDQPPKEARKLEQLGPVNGSIDTVDALAGLPYEIRRAARDFPVTLFARDDCHVCDDARAYLRAHGVPYAERSVITRGDIEAFRRLGGGEQLPAVQIGRQVLQGYEPVAWGEALANAGYPQGIALPRTWRWSAASPLAPVAPSPTPPAGDTGEATAETGSAPGGASASQR